ncbi:MAG: ABC transporter permease subunit [Pirellulales bacterium]
MTHPAAAPRFRRTAASRPAWWIRQRLPLAIVGFGVTAGGLWLGGWPLAAAAVAATCALALAFTCGIRLLRQALSGGYAISGVARAVVDEAIGSRTPVLFMIVLALGLPILPLVLDSTERLEYRLQFFMTWALSASAFLLSLVTIVLACGSVCGDIDSQRIHMTLAKPVERWQYLVGKWLGIVLFDGVLLGVLGCGIYLGALGLGRMPALDAADRRAVEEQVFTARSSLRPEHPEQDGFEASISAAIDQIQKDEPEAFAADPAAVRRRIRSERVLAWHTITADVVSSYVFRGLDPGRLKSDILQLRLKPFADNVGVDRAEVRFALWLNDRPYPVRGGRHEEYTLPSLMFHTIDIPASAVDASGSLKVTIANRNLVPPGETQPTSLSFSPGKGLELLYRSGGFTGNFFRGLLVGWAKLAMLTAAALAAGSCLAFPTAVLASLMVYVSAVARGFLADAIDIYTGVDSAHATLPSMIRMRGTMLLERLNRLEWWDAVKTVTSIAADGFLGLVPSFSMHDGVTEVATGLHLPLTQVLVSIGILALAYPIVLLAGGWWLLDRRDLVNVSGS